MPRATFDGDTLPAKAGTPYAGRSFAYEISRLAAWPDGHCYDPTPASAIRRRKGRIGKFRSRIHPRRPGAVVEHARDTRAGGVGVRGFHWLCLQCGWGVLSPG